MMKSPFKSNHLESQSPRAERLDELAVILARGILRLREKLAKSAADPLDVFDETRLTVSPGFDTRSPTATGAKHSS